MKTDYSNLREKTPFDLIETDEELRKFAKVKGCAKTLGSFVENTKKRCTLNLGMRYGVWFRFASIFNLQELRRELCAQFTTSDIGLILD